MDSANCHLEPINLGKVLLCNTFPKFIGSLIAVSKDVQENKEPIFCGMGEAAPQKIGSLLNRRILNVNHLIRV
jgi:hypothetical protein